MSKGSSRKDCNDLKKRAQMTPEQRAAELEANRLRKLKAIRRERLIVVTVELTSESRIPVSDKLHFILINSHESRNVERMGKIKEEGKEEVQNLLLDANTLTITYVVAALRSRVRSHENYSCRISLITGEHIMKKRVFV